MLNPESISVLYHDVFLKALVMLRGNNNQWKQMLNDPGCYKHDDAEYDGAEHDFVEHNGVKHMLNMINVDELHCIELILDYKQICC